jgi:hypothetical protein
VGLGNVGKMTETVIGTVSIMVQFAKIDESIICQSVNLSIPYLENIAPRKTDFLKVLS